MRRFALIVTVCLVAGCSSSGSPASSPSAPSSSAATTPAATPSGSATGTPTGTPTAPPLKQGKPRLALVGRFSSPVDVTAPVGDPRLFVVEQGGRIRIVRDGKVLPAPFLDISASVLNSGEQGLLSLAFAPDFATSRKFYVNYNAKDGDVRLAEFRAGANPDRADAATRRELLRIDKPFANHNGGLVVFDRAGMLLLSTGDGGGANDPGNRAQNLADLHGKILRIDPRPAGGKPYGIPKDNPFVGHANARPEVWAYGLRNPWRYSFDPPTGILYIGDVGQYAVEEIDAVPAARQRGANYGWRVFEGRRRNFEERIASPDRVVTPVHTYLHDGGHCAVMGGVVYRGSVAALRGRYLFADHCTGEIWYFAAGTSDQPPVSPAPFRGGTPNSFGVDARGEVYVVSASGEVWQITA